MPSPISYTPPHVHVARIADEKPMNPAQQAKAAEPAVTGRAFGQLVSSIAKAKHEATPVTPAPIPEAPVSQAPGDVSAVDIKA